MSILKIARMGHPILRQIAKELTVEEIQSETIQKLIDDMLETMIEYQGVGIAAPQVHHSVQISIIEVKENVRYPQAPSIPLTILINPKITFLTDEKKIGWEGCLSLPELRGAVPRFTKIHVSALDRNADLIEFEAEGFKAIVIQHETDHLFGKLFIDRMEDLTKLFFQDEWNKYSVKLPKIDTID